MTVKKDDKAPEVPETAPTVEAPEVTEVASTGTEQTEHWVVSITENSGRRILTISQPGWVGPAPLSVPADYAEELIDALTKLVK